MTEVSNHAWYQTSREFSWTHENGRVYRGPSREVHAKRPGTTFTACGLPCETWQKFWHLPYRLHDGRSCPLCDIAIIGSVPQAASS